MHVRYWLDNGGGLRLRAVQELFILRDELLFARHAICCETGQYNANFGCNA